MGQVDKSVSAYEEYRNRIEHYAALIAADLANSLPSHNNLTLATLDSPAREQIMDRIATIAVILAKKVLQKVDEDIANSTKSV